MAKIDQLSREVIKCARSIFGKGYVPLHRPVFDGNERCYLTECIDSNFVSSVGAKVEEFEMAVAEFTASQHAVATVNGTAALHTAVQLAGVKPGDEVISQALTFVATCNAISYVGASPIFVDVDRDTLGLSPTALSAFLEENVEMRQNMAINKKTGSKIAACIPMHTFGLPCRIEEIAAICNDWNITLIEDAAESLGSYVGGKHTGSFGLMSTLSFNGNKVITTGGGGMILTSDASLAKQAKHITTTAKVAHAYEFVHDDVGYNYRMPNLNAALGVAQMEQLPSFLDSKNIVAAQWESLCDEVGVQFVKPIEGTKANYWLNAIVLDGKNERDAFLKHTNDNGIMTRPIWTLMSKLPMFNHCQNDGLVNSLWLVDRVVNLPSSVPCKAIKNGASRG